MITIVLTLMTLMSNLTGESTVARMTYYVSLTGSDLASGADPHHALRSLSKAAKLPLVDGDQILLEGGSTFEGSLSITKSLTVGSYGKGKATISSPIASGITVEASNVVIQNINLVGRAAKKTDKHYGIALLSTGSRRIGFRSIRIHDLEISGFGAGGILIGSSDENRTGFKEVTISNCIVRANYGAGIASWDDAKDRSKGYAHHDLTIRDCAVTGNLDGTGIVIGGVERALIERCEVRDSVGNGGGVGLWAWMAKGVVIRHCIVSGTKSLGGDGGGVWTVSSRSAFRTKMMAQDSCIAIIRERLPPRTIFAGNQ
ncbi:MAG: right-handed parallel beta-helix repeat-containing protein [Fimbriimonadales bacterium]|nr:right-handed parallel beta-helix repeat-containing protein [Fimbriimonadales bacterium]